MPLPPWWDKRRESQNRRSRAQERSIASEAGGRTHPGSGSSWRKPRDISTDEFLVEAKYTDKAGYPLNVAEWEALRRDALRAGKEPVLVIDFPNRNLRLFVLEEPFEE